MCLVNVNRKTLNCESKNREEVWKGEKSLNIQQKKKVELEVLRKYTHRKSGQEKFGHGSDKYY